MTSFTIKPEQLNISEEDNLLSVYEFGTGIARHYFCKSCGIFTFVQTRLNPGEYRINLGCLDQVDSFGLPASVYAGSDL